MKQIFITLIVFFAMNVSANPGLDPNIYKNNSTKQTEWALDFFKSYTITGKERKILDLGCGNGLITVKLAEMFPNAVEWVGMDISKSMIEQAKIDFSKEKFPNVSFIEGGAEYIPFKEEFDLVVSFSTMHFVMEQEKALKEIYDSIAADGTLLIFVTSKHDKNTNPLAGLLMTSEKWKTYFPKGYTPSRVYFTASEYENMLKKVGFDAVQIDVVDKDDIYSTMDDFVNSMIAVLNYVPESIRREFTLDLISLLDISQDSHGQVHAYNKFLHITAKKGDKK